jgi:hypothetical protein
MMCPDAIVEEIEIILPDSFPVEVDVVAKGYTGSDGCFNIYTDNYKRGQHILYTKL